MSKIILFATFWNEIEWVEASLDQISLINPQEAILCDGCFDPAYPNQSTDGTREIIQSYVSKNDNMRMISAVRLTKLQHCFNWLRPLPHESAPALFLPRLRYATGLHRWNIYRLNQAATFNYMLRISSCFRPGVWFMTYDCDQFYSDTMLKLFYRLNEGTPCNMLSGKELTFFDSFEAYSDNYEKRDYNNMPHRAFHDTRFIPTRHPARVVNGRYAVYSTFETKMDAGVYFHYHIKSTNRMKLGYSLGNRRSPEEARIATMPFTGEHPTLIKERFLPCRH